MSTEVKVIEKLWGAKLPVEKIKQIESYIEKRKEQATPPEKVTNRSILFLAMDEYMQNHPVK